jgi:hypothetical protein
VTWRACDKAAGLHADSGGAAVLAGYALPSARSGACVCRHPRDALVAPTDVPAAVRRRSLSSDLSCDCCSIEGPAGKLGHPSSGSQRSLGCSASAGSRFRAKSGCLVPASTTSLFLNTANCKRRAVSDRLACLSRFVILRANVSEGKGVLCKQFMVLVFHPGVPVMVATCAPC